MPPHAWSLCVLIRSAHWTDAGPRGRRGPPSRSPRGPRSPAGDASLARSAPSAPSPHPGSARHDPSRRRPPAAARPGAPRPWGPTAPGHRRSPARGPQAPPRRPPVAPGPMAGGWIPAAPGRVASSLGARTRRLRAPRAVGAFARCPPVPPPDRGADASLSSPCAAAARSWCSRRGRSSHRRRGRCGAGRRRHHGMSSLGPRGGGGGQRSPYPPLLGPGLRPELVHHGDEIQ